jgi:hypothetical protein
MTLMETCCSRQSRKEEYMSPGAHSNHQPQVTARLPVDAHDDCWERLVLEFFEAEIDHGLAALASSDAKEHERAVADALLTVELARQFEPGIEDPQARESLHARAAELAHRAA